jgi:hypothetical protein
MASVAMSIWTSQTNSGGFSDRPLAFNRISAADCLSHLPLQCSASEMKDKLYGLQKCVNTKISNSSSLIRRNFLELNQSPAVRQSRKAFDHLNFKVYFP